MENFIDSLITAALDAVNPYPAMMRHLHRSGEHIYFDRYCYTLSSWDIRCVAVGKASVPMARSIAEIITNNLSQGIVVTKHGHLGSAQFSGQWETIESGHPIPDDLSLSAGDRVEHLLHRTTDRTLIIACISGGASALMVAPHAWYSLQQLLLASPTSDLSADTQQLIYREIQRQGIDLDLVDAQSIMPLTILQGINTALLASGLAIQQMNVVRSKLDRLKAGGLVHQANPGKVIGLILSDVVGDPIASIGSGLTNHPAATNILIGNNLQACEAVAKTAQKLGYDVRIVTRELVGEARVRGREIARKTVALPPKTVLIYGGETTVTLPVDNRGKGGRNQELALAAAIELDLHHTPAWIVTLATDGTDGPTDAAGATVNELTIAHARSLGLDAKLVLDRHDSYSLFEQLGALHKIGATGTNVADITIAIRP